MSRASSSDPASASVDASDAVTLLGVLLFGAGLAGYVPLPVLAAILFVVAWNMGEWREIPDIWKQTYTDAVVWLITVTLTVLADLTVAVEAGMVMAAEIFLTHPGVGTAGFEQNLIVTDTGPELLTRTPMLFG